MLAVLRAQGLGGRETPYLIIADAMAATRADGVLGGRWESWLCNVHNSLSTLIGASTFALGSPAWRSLALGWGQAGLSARWTGARIILGVINMFL